MEEKISNKNLTKIDSCMMHLLLGKNTITQRKEKLKLADSRKTLEEQLLDSY